jgi:hypothetical protein
MKKVIMAFIFGMVLNSVAIADKCRPINLDVCEGAQFFAKDMSSVLPLNLNQNMTLSTAVAYENQLHIGIFYRIPRKELERQVKEAPNFTWDDLVHQMNIHQTTRWCSIPELKKFITQGGVVVSHYNFVDAGEPMRIIVDSCK